MTYSKTQILISKVCSFIVHSAAQFSYLYAEDNRVYAYLRFETGDEMSRRAKFAFVTWIGPAVPPLKKAKVSTDKAFVKQVFVVS